MLFKNYNKDRLFKTVAYHKNMLFYEYEHK